MVAATGTRDLIPPQGQFTVELLDERGRVRHTAKAENSIMDWYLKASPRNGGRYRRGDLTYALAAPLWLTASMESVGTLTVPQFEDWSKPNSWPFRESAVQLMRWLWVSDSAAAVNAGKNHIPTTDALGELTAGVSLDYVFEPDGIQNRRGNLSPAASYVTRDQIRMVVEFAPGIGTGIYRSLGIGNLVCQEEAPGGIRPAWAYVNRNQAGDQNNWVGSTDALATSGNMLGGMDWDADTQRFRGDGGGSSGMYVYDADYGYVLLVAEGNMPGAGNVQRCMVTVPGIDKLFIGQNQTLFDCVKPVSNVAMTVNNTYDLSATLGAEKLLDMCTDGTNIFAVTETRIVEIDPSDGSVLGTVLHNVPDNGPFGTIGWDGSEEAFAINRFGTLGSDEGWGTTAAGSYGWPVADSCVTHFIDKTGAHTGKRVMHNQNSSGTDQQALMMPVGAMSPDGTKMIMQKQSDAPSYLVPAVPSMASHALLPADVDKTVLDGLRITYDWNFTV